MNWNILVLLAVIGIASALEIGTFRRYSFETTTTINEDCQLDDHFPLVGHRIRGTVQLSAIWTNTQRDKLIKIEILSPKLFVPKKGSFIEHRSQLDSLTLSPSFLLWKDGVSKRYWDDSAEDASLRNLKRAIASLLHFPVADQIMKENDVSGSCDVLYEAKGRAIRKRKANCQHPGFDQTLSQAYGVRSAVVHHQSIIDYELEDEVAATITQCTVSEYIRLLSNTWRRPSLCVDAKTELIFKESGKASKIYKEEKIEDVIANMKKENKKEGLQESKLEAILNENKPTQSKAVKSLVKQYQDRLNPQNVVNLKSAVVFYKLLPAFRAASKEEILEILQDKNLKKIKPVLMDLTSACATEICIEAALEQFSKLKGYDEDLERFSISLSVLPRPQLYVLKQLKAFIEKKKHEKRLQASLLATLGTLVKTYSKNHQIANQQVVEDIRIFLEDGLAKCDDESCIQSYLRSLRNAALPHSIPLFLKYVGKGDKYALESILAIRQIPNGLFASEKKLLDVFHQVEAKQDRSVRAIAADLLLRNEPRKEVVKSILQSLSDKKEVEFSTYLATKILQKMEEDSSFRKIVMEFLQENDLMYSYISAQVGKSSLFHRPMISLSGMNVTYGLEMEMLGSGLMKRSVFDVGFQTDAGDIDLLSVSVFAEGLGSFVGEESDEGSSPSAGMDLGFLGHIIRPYIFFTSSGELMGHVWSGTASELTPIMQSMSTFSDDERLIVLTNGMILRGHLRGIFASDASASIQISLWNRNSQSLVQYKGAMLMRGSVGIDMGFVTTQGDVQFNSQSEFDFNTDIDFYESPFKICLQMKHPDLAARFDVHRSVVISGSKYHMRRSKKRTMKIPGRSFALHKQNFAMCQALLGRQ